MRTFVVHARPFSSIGYLPCGGVTFAISRGKLGYKMAYAECSKKDHYCRRIGRTIAEARLYVKKFWQVKTKSGLISKMGELAAKNRAVIPTASILYLDERL